MLLTGMFRGIVNGVDVFRWWGFAGVAELCNSLKTVIGDHGRIIYREVKTGKTLTVRLGAGSFIRESRACRIGVTTSHWSPILKKRHNSRMSAARQYERKNEQDERE